MKMELIAIFFLSLFILPGCLNMPTNNNGDDKDAQYPIQTIDSIFGIILMDDLDGKSIIMNISFSEGDKDPDMNPLWVYYSIFNKNGLVGYFEDRARINSGETLTYTVTIKGKPPYAIFPVVTGGGYSVSYTGRFNIFEKWDEKNDLWNEETILVSLTSLKCSAETTFYVSDQTVFISPLSMKVNTDWYGNMSLFGPDGNIQYYDEYHSGGSIKRMWGQTAIRGQRTLKVTADLPALENRTWYYRYTYVCFGPEIAKRYGFEFPYEEYQ
jgi:hypothetical protein